MLKMTTPVLFFSLCDYVHDFLLSACVCEGCAPYIPVFILIDHSGFGYPFGSVNDDAINNILKEISMDRGLMWNDTYICGGRLSLKTLVRGSYDMHRSLMSESAMMFNEPWCVGSARTHCC